MARFYEPDLGATPDDPFARDADGKLVRRSYWLDMSDRSLVLTMTSGIGARITNEEKRVRAGGLGTLQFVSHWRTTDLPGTRCASHVQVGRRSSAEPDGESGSQPIHFQKSQPDVCRSHSISVENLKRET